MIDTKTKSKILIVEDSTTIAVDIKRKLLALGYDVSGIVTEGEKAVQVAGELLPDLILMDIILRGEVDGIHAAQTILERFNIPCIYVTGHTDHQLERLLQSNPYGYIVKPADSHMMKITIEMALNKHALNLQLQQSINQKEMLCKEIHHRVKNNFYIISSLIELQMENIRDAESKQLIMDIHSRIKAMSLIHERLYQSDDIDRIEFGNYIQMITKDLHNMFNLSSKTIIAKLDLEEIFLLVEQAIPCGLILNELLTNIYKYAFPENYNGEPEISISFHKKEHSTVELKVSDNGAGMSDEIDIDTCESLGLKMVSMLTKQLNGTFSITSKSGMMFVIKFKNRIT